MGEETQTLLRSISAYVPELVLRQVLTYPYASLAGWEERMAAALLFADVSGFTAMSESLARLGKEGAEELTRILNEYFTTMIDLVRSYGGQVISFGGDAVTCAFACDPAGSRIVESADLRTCVLRACACALAMQKEMVRFQEVKTSGGVSELRMKIGISAGPVLFLSLGDQQRGLECVLAGHPLDRMAEAEHRATAGEVVIDGKWLEDVELSWEDLGIVVGEERDGFSLVEQLTQAVKRTEGGEVDRTALSEGVSERVMAQLVPYLPQTVFERIVEGQRQFVGEHRQVVSLFVNFVGIDYDGDPGAGQKLQRYFVAMQEIIHRYGGRLNWISTGDKGSLLHLIFGAPVAYEDNEVRAVGCALTMQQRIRESGELSFITDQRIGIASGYVFAGDVGSERRRGYTVMGDVVNLSARLMQAAEAGGILLDWRTARQAGQDFVCEELTPIRVKGKEKPVPVCRPIGVREETKVWLDREARSRRRGSPFVGRRQELTRLGEVVERVVAGQGQLLVITGEAGVGKSRLLEELVDLAQKKAQGMYGLGGDCLSYGSQSPYLPWIDLLTSFFGLGLGEGRAYEDRVRKIEQRMVEADSALADWVPLVGQVLGLSVPDNELTASLDAQLRKQRTFDIILNLLRHQASQVPLFLLVFEDVHWIDTISLELLNYVARNIAGHRILLVVLHRPAIELTEWNRYTYCHRIDLADLPANDAQALIELRLAMEVPEQLRELQDKVLRGEEQTNPFFVEESINALIDRGYLVPADGEGYRLVGDLEEVEIPDSVQALVMSRIDRLDESSKLTVKVASIIGGRFRRLMLQGIYPVEIPTERLWENLDALNERDLTPLDTPAPEWEYIFKNIITRDVAYESLLFAHRRELHHRVGEYVEQAYADSLEEYYELLAHHYYQSGDPEKSWEYLIKAGDKAKGRYANEAAIDHYERALSLDSGPGRGREDVCRVYESLGDVYRLRGEFEEALESYGEALGHQPPTIAQVAEIRRKVAKTWELRGRYDEAMQHIGMARAALAEEQETPEMARIYSDMAWIAMRQGDYKRALQLSAKGLDVADRLPSDEKSHRVKARLQYTLGIIYWRMVDYPQAMTHLQTCIEMQESIGDLQQMSGAYNNLAVVYWSQGDYDLAAQYFRESLEISQKIGDTYGTAQCYNNLGVICYTLGDHPHAIEYYERSLGIRGEIGDLLGVGDVYLNLGEVHHSLGDHQRALHHLQDAVELYKEIGGKTNLVDAYRLLAEVELELGDTDEALEYCQLSLDLAQEIGDQEYEGIAYRVLGQIHRTSGRSEEARRYLQSSVDILMSIGNQLELGKSHYELGVTLSAMGLEAGREQLQRAIQIFEELGVEGELDKARAALGDP